MLCGRPYAKLLALPGGSPPRPGTATLPGCSPSGKAGGCWPKSAPLPGWTAGPCTAACLRTGTPLAVWRRGCCPRRPWSLCGWILWPGSKTAPCPTRTPPPWPTSRPGSTAAGPTPSLRQVVVDEAQDLDSLQGALLGLLFPKARFTFLGDVHQALAGPGDLGLYEQLRGALGKEHSLLVKLEKSFRCTREIWAFSARFLPPGTAGECFSRSGEAPGLYRAAGEKELDALALGHASQCLQAGHRSVALLCKTQRDAKALYRRLRGEPQVALVGPEDVLRNGRISILSLYTAKGLEFDAALLYGVDGDRYRDEEDRSLLCIGCTCALHVLGCFTRAQKPAAGRWEEMAG